MAARVPLGNGQAGGRVTSARFGAAFTEGSGGVQGGPGLSGLLLLFFGGEGGRSGVVRVLQSSPKNSRVVGELRGLPCGQSPWTLRLWEPGPCFLNFCNRPARRRLQRALASSCSRSMRLAEMG